MRFLLSRTLRVATIFVTFMAFALRCRPPRFDHVESDLPKTNSEPTTKTIKVHGVITQASADRFLEDFLATAKLAGPRTILINSPGGEVEAGKQMIALMEAERARGVKQICIVHGDASSMAFNLLTHCDVRLATARSVFLIHKDAWGEIDCVQQRCTARMLRQMAKDMDKEDDAISIVNAKAMHLSLRDYNLFADQERTWTVSDLIARGYLTGIVDASQK